MPKVAFLLIIMLAALPPFASRLFAQAQSATALAPTQGATQGLVPGDISTFTLGSGMEVLLLPLPGSASVSMSIVFRGGADVQTNKTAGLFRMLEQVLFRGTTTSLGEPEPAGAMDALGAQTVDGGTQADRFGLSFLIPPDMVSQGLDTIAYLFSDLRLETAFSDPLTFEEARSASLVASTRTSPIQALSSNRRWRESSLSPRPGASM